MKIHYFQHVPFEKSGIIENWAKDRSYTIAKTKFFKPYKEPDINSINILFIMGGPMGIYNEKDYPWLTEEKKIIEKAIKQNKIVIGICLGAQLIADVLGVKIYKNQHKEIGWFPVYKTEKCKQNNHIISFPDSMTVFHWHSDTFDIPENAIHVLRSDACENQAFVYNKKIFAFQFHLESTMDSINGIIKNCKDELINTDYIQKENKILEKFKRFGKQNNKILYDFLRNFE